MYYTPEELLETVRSDPDMYFGAVNALTNNDKGFDVLPVDPEWIHMETDTPYVSMPALSGSEERMEVPIGDKNEEIANMLNNTDHTRLRVFLIQKKTDADMSIYFLFLEVGDDEDEYDAVHDALLLNFFEVAGINTKGRLKNVIQRGLDLCDDDTEDCFDGDMSDFDPTILKTPADIRPPVSRDRIAESENTSKK